MTAVARIPLNRVPAREPEPKRLRDDRVKREFGDDLENETTKKFERPAQPPTPEQLALAGLVVPQPVQADPQLSLETAFEVAFAQMQGVAAPQLAAAMPAITEDAAAGEELPATPLEQAVIEMLDKQPSELPDVVFAKAEVVRDVPAAKIQQAAPVALPRELPEMAAPTSHVNLVMDDGDRRVVVTVAVRGNDVNVHMRGDDDAAASFARNAGSLDEAMRARGLSLAELSARRDSDPQDPRDRPQYERRETVGEVFTLEETA